MTELAVSDAIVALRSFSRRYREAFDGLDAGALRARRDGWSILDHAADAADRLERFEGVLGPALNALHPATEDLDQEPAAPPTSASTEPEAVLRRIAAASTAMATRAEAAPSEAWDRTFTSGGVERPARWIVQRAVAVVASRLRDIERARETLGR